MSAIGSTAPGLQTQATKIGLATVQRVALWLFVFSGWFVIVEPAPYEALFALALIAFLPSGLAASISTAPMVVFLLLYNMGGVMSLTQAMGDSLAVQFVAVSVYMAITSWFFAFAVAQDPMGIMPVLRSAYIFAGVAAALVALASYFDVGGTAAAYSPMNRAQGAFKDPNVLGTFLVPPIIFLVQAFITRTQRWRPVAMVSLGLMVTAVLLTFSRGAWINVAGSAVLVFAVTFLVTPSVAVRGRVVLLALVAAFATACMVIVALSLPEVHDMLIERSSLLQSYDVGETGRFGTQLNGVKLLSGLANGVGPLQFWRYLGQDPHNVYLNAFASYGWLGGFSYILLVAATLMAGWRVMFTRSPWQGYAIAVACPLIMTIAQGVQIDTDHWRHFYLLLGVVWGLYAATENHRRVQSVVTN